MLGRLRALFGWGKDVWDVLGWLGVTGIVTGVATSVGGTMWAVISGVPTPIALMAGYCTLVGAVYLLLAPLIFRALVGGGLPGRSGRVKPNYAAWRHVSLLRVDQAAALWCERDPASKGTAPDEKTWIDVFKDAIRRKEIRVTLAEYADETDRKWATQNPQNNTTVLRTELQKFAKAHGYDPVFLRD